MTAAPSDGRRPVALVVTVMLILLAGLPAATSASSHDDEIYAILDLPRGDIEFELDTGLLQFFDEENAPFVVQIIDGCAVNDHYWILGAGLAPEAAALTVIDGRSGQSERIVLPPLEAGSPVPAVLDTQALQICRAIQTGGLPVLAGTGSYTAATPRCFDSTDAIELLSDGRDDAYRTLIRGGFEVNRVIRDRPVAVVDDSNDYDELHLFTGGRTPRSVEGVAFSGAEGMLPARGRLDEALKPLKRARVRRAFETAKAGRIPRGIIEDLGLKGIECVHHVSLDMETLGADAYLAEARWIKEGGRPLEPPVPVEDRFEVDVVRADGESTTLPLTGPLVGSDEAGSLWHYGEGDVQVQLADACSLTGSFWTIAAAQTDEPVELVVTDRSTDASGSFLLWTDRPEPAWVADTDTLAACA